MHEVTQIYSTRPVSPRQWTRKTSISYSAFKRKQ